MTTDFWDTSALAKLYLNEIGSEWAASRAAEDDVAVSQLAHVEMASLLARRRAAGDFDSETQRHIYARYLNDLRKFEVIPFNDSLASRAAALVLSGTFGTRVRSLDAVQLATAELWFESSVAHTLDVGAFVVADGALGTAAAALGLPVENPEEYE